MIDLNWLLEIKPTCFDSREKFREALLEKYSSHMRSANILTLLWDCGIVAHMQREGAPSENEIAAILCRMEKEYGIMPQYTKDALRSLINLFSHPAHETEQPTYAATPVIVNGNENEYEFEIIDGCVTLKCYMGFDDGTIVVPNRMRGFPVTIIGAQTFANYKNIKRVVISSGIQEIQSGAFNGCSELEVVEMPDTVVKIGQINPVHMTPHMNGFARVAQYAEGVFQGCTQLHTVRMSNTLNVIGQNTFEGCAQLKNIELPDSLLEIGEDSFNQCRSLKHITIPCGVKKIPYGCFHNSTLEDVILSDQLEIIEEYAFYTSYLKSIRIPASVIKIEDYAFEKCAGLPVIVCYASSEAYRYARKNGNRVQNAEIRE